MLNLYLYKSLWKNLIEMKNLKKTSKNLENIHTIFITEPQ